MIIPISNKILDDFKLTNEEYLVDQEFYHGNSGVQEYRLYSYLTTFFNDITILDIGTLQGRSAVSLSYNDTNNVISYDIQNHINNNYHKIYSKKNIKFNIKNVLDELTEDLIQKVKIVMIDIDHYETIETKIIKRLKELNFSGIIILDDITKHPDPIVNICMKKLWDNIEDTKYDFTVYGHWSGTGIIVLNDDITFKFE
jgi:predicted O-methyltransferase YrrM